MKRITVTTNSVALVYKKGELARVLEKGTYWLRFGEEAFVYDMAKPLVASAKMDVLLLNADFAKLVQEVSVAENQLAVMYQDNVFKAVLSPGRYFFWKAMNNYAFILVETGNYEISPEIDRNLFAKTEMVNYIRIYRVDMFEKGMLTVDGKFVKILEPGVYFYWKNAQVINVAVADLRLLSMELSGQEILTRDKAQLRLNVSFRYKVVDMMKALSGNKEFEKQLYVLMQLAVREYVGKLGLDELIEAKDTVSSKVLEILAEKSGSLGVEIVDCGVKDIIFPGDVKEIMNKVLVAEKNAQANMITRREETASTRSLLNTARLMEENAMLYKLKEMEYVEKIAEKIQTITLSGGGQVADQLKQLFVVK